MPVNIHEFWRVGYHVDPLHVTLEFQNGSGRFDDPQRQKVVLYGANTIRTCILKLALPWVQGNDEYAATTTHEPDPEDANDGDLAAAIAADAVHDEAIAKRRRRLPQLLYEKAKVQAFLERPAQFVELNSPGIRMELHDAIPFVATRFVGLNLVREQFDKSLLTSQHLDITRAISGFLMRKRFEGAQADGLACDSRHDGTNYVLFEGRYVIARYTDPIRLTSNDPDIIAVATELRWDP